MVESDVKRRKVFGFEGGFKNEDEIQVKNKKIYGRKTFNFLQKFFYMSLDVINPSQFY